VVAELFVAVSDNKKTGEGKGMFTKLRMGFISPMWGADPIGPISTAVSKLVGIDDDIIILISVFWGFHSYRRSKFPFSH